MPNASLVRDYLKNFKGYEGELVQRGVFNCVRIIDYARNGDIRGEDLSQQDLTLCSLIGRNCNDVAFNNSKINSRLFFSQIYDVESIRSVVYSSCGHFISFVSSRGIHIWHNETGKEIRSFEGRFKSINYSPNGSFILSTANKRYFSENSDELQILDSKSGSIIASIAGNFDDASYSPDGKYIVSASAEGLEIWNSDVTNLMMRINGSFKSASYSPDGKFIVSTTINNSWLKSNSQDNSTHQLDYGVHIWNSRSGERIRCFEFKHKMGTLFSARFSPDGKHIVSASSYGIDVFNSETGDSIYGRNIGYFYSANYNPSGKEIVTASENGIQIWNEKTGELIRTLEEFTYAKIISAYFSHDDKRIISISRPGKGICIWDAKTCKLLNTIGEDYFDSARYSPDDKFIISASNKGIQIWDSLTYEFLYNFSNGYYSSACYSPDGKHIVSTSSAGMQIWNSEAKETIRTIGVGFYISANYSPDGMFLVSVSKNGIQTWNCKTGELIKSMDSEYSCNRCEANFSPDGKYIVSSKTKDVDLWDSKSGRHIRHIWNPSESINTSTCFNSTGKLILSTSFDGSIKIWNNKIDHNMPNDIVVNAIHKLSTQILNADFTGVEFDGIKDYEIASLKQNGAIVEGVELSC